jgi:hypothetical protein
MLDSADSNFHVRDFVTISSRVRKKIWKKQKEKKPGFTQAFTCVDSLVPFLTIKVNDVLTDPRTCCLPHTRRPTLTSITQYSVHGTLGRVLVRGSYQIPDSSFPMYPPASRLD